MRAAERTGLAQIAAADHAPANPRWVSSPSRSRFLRESVRLLQQIGVATRAAGDVAEARSMMKKHRFDVVLVDLRLPGEDGPLLVEELEADPFLAGRSIVVTAFPTVAKIFSTSLPVVAKSNLKEIQSEVERVLAQSKGSPVQTS